MSSNKLIIGIIGGSGIYDLFKDKPGQQESVQTPFGTISLSKFEFDDKIVYFLPRHGTGHSIPPHMINFKANIFGLFTLGVRKIIATNAVGSLKPNIKPGEFVILDQFIDLASGPHTFFDGKYEIDLGEGGKKNGVQHTDVTTPYSQKLRSILIQSSSEFSDEVYHPKGCYVMFNGPRFETSAEIKMFSNFADVVGMTGTPEVILSNEIGIEYASINLVTNFGAGIQSSVSHNEVIEVFERKVGTLKSILARAISKL